MAKVTLIFALVLILLGVAALIVSGGNAHAFIPGDIGLLLAVFGGLSFNPNPARRKLFMHINVTIGLLGFLFGVFLAIHTVTHALHRNVAIDYLSLGSKLTMTVLLLVYVILCVRSFIAARRERKI